MLDVGMSEHLVLGPGIIDPALAAFQIHRAEFPQFRRIGQALLKPALLFLVADRKPVLDQLDSVTDQHAFELGAAVQECAIFLFRAKSHHPLDPGTVVPGAVENDDLARGGQMRDVALKIPLRLFAFGRGRQRHDMTDPGVERLGDALDRASFACGVAALEDDRDTVARCLDPFLQLDQFDLKPSQFGVILLGADPR